MRYYLKTTLQKLFLNGNNIGDEGVQALASAIANGSPPTKLKVYLKKNKIGEQAKKVMQSVAQTKQGITVLF